MKKLELLLALLLVSSVSYTQSRGRGDNQNIQSNNNKQINVQQTVTYSLNNYSNVGNLNNNYVFDNVGNPSQSNNNINVNRGGVNMNKSNGENARLVQRRNEVNFSMVQVNNIGNAGNQEGTVYEQEPINVSLSNLDNNVFVSNEIETYNESQNMDFIEDIEQRVINDSETNLNDVEINFELNVSQVQLKMPEFIVEKNNNAKEEKTGDNTDVDSFYLSINLPQVKKENSRSKKVKRPKNFAYRQHQSISGMIKNKSKVFAKILAKKTPKKVVCSVVCYKF